MNALISLTLAFAYAGPDPRTAINPMWAGFRLPRGAPGIEPGACEAPTPFVPASSQPSRADVCIVGFWRRRRPDSGHARAGGPRRRRARGGRELQRARLQRARTARVPAAVLARRTDPDGRLQRHVVGRVDARRRADRQLVQLPAHAREGAGAVGARIRPRGRSTGPISTATSTRSGRDSVSTQRLLRISTVRTERMRDGAAGTRLVVHDPQPQRGPGRATRPIRPATSASATAPAPSSTFVAPISATP